MPGTDGLTAEFYTFLEYVGTGYLQGRFIGENIRVISDILHYTADQN